MARASKYRVGTGRHVLVGVFIELANFSKSLCVFDLMGLPQFLKCSGSCTHFSDDLEVRPGCASMLRPGGSCVITGRDLWNLAGDSFSPLYFIGSSPFPILSGGIV